jgi:ribonuclease E
MMIAETTPLTQRIALMPDAPRRQPITAHSLRSFAGPMEEDLDEDYEVEEPFEEDDDLGDDDDLEVDYDDDEAGGYSGAEFVDLDDDADPIDEGYDLEDEEDDDDLYGDDDDEDDDDEDEEEFYEEDLDF